MNITITINNASYEVLAAISRSLAEKAAPHQPAVQDAPIITPQPAQPTHDDSIRIASVADIDNYLDIGTEVHWHGVKFVFDGVVERIETDGAGVPDTDGWYDDRVKVLFIRRNDTDKLVSLTLRDLQTGRLTLID